MPTTKSQTLRKQIDRWKANLPPGKLPSISSFYIYSGRRRTTVSDWKTHEPECYDIFRHHVVEFVREKVIEKGLNGNSRNCNPQFLMWYLKAACNMSEERVSIDDTSPIKVILNIENSGDHKIFDGDN